ncbi:MAG: substrate-binding domain-containing protein [Butyrivibrio sp.]|nr:substrate-binding domain-containing protein [Butyrivibrio sp.]
MKGRNLFIMIVSALLIVMLTASTSALILSGIAENPTRVCVVVEDSGSGRWTSFTAGLEQAAKDMGVKLTVLPTTRNQTLSQQYAQMNEAISDGADGIILQACGSSKTENMISDISSKAVLVLIDGEVDTDVDVEGKSACIEPDNLEIGRALANEVRTALGNDLTGYSIGIVAGNQRRSSNIQRLNGFMENIESSGAEILWMDNSRINTVDKIRTAQTERTADILVALDNDGLESVCEYVLQDELSPYIFGEGTSIKNVSYIDDGLINSMVVPNEYYMGYQSIAAIAERMDNRLTPMQNEMISYRIVNRDNLFDESNQRVLFPVVE